MYVQVVIHPVLAIATTCRNMCTTFNGVVLVLIFGLMLMHSLTIECGIHDQMV